MKRIILLIFILISIQSLGQYNYINAFYRWRGGMFDSSLHIPRYNGTPSGLRTGSSVQDGAIAIDTTNNILYIYSGGAWIAQTGNNIYNSNGILSGNRTLTGLNETYSLLFDSLNSFLIRRNNKVRFNVDGTNTYMSSPNGNNTVQVYDGYIRLMSTSNSNEVYIRQDSSLFHNRASYEGNIHGTFKPFSLIDKSYADSLISAVSLDLQDVTDNGSVTTNKITAQSFHASSPGEGFKINVDASGNVITTGYSTAITQNNGNGDLYIQPSAFSQTSGSPPGYGTSNLILHADGGVSLPNLASGSSTDSVVVIDPSTGKLKKRNSSSFGGTSTNIYNSDGTLTGYRTLDMAGNPLEFDNTGTGGVHFYIDPVNTDYYIGDISGTNNGSYFRIVDTATVTPRYIMYNMQQDVGTKAIRYNPSTGKVSYADTTTGGGTVTSFSFTDANGFTGSVANSTTTPALTLNIGNPSFEDWYSLKDDFKQSIYDGFLLGSNGTASSVAAMTTSDIIDGWMYGIVLNTGTSTTGNAYFLSSSGGASPVAPIISINSSVRFNAGSKIRLEDLSDGTDTYEAFFGFMEIVTESSSIVDGVYFRYTNADSSGKWIACTESNNTKTEVQTSVTVAADTDYELAISVFNGHAYFWIASGLSGSLTLVADITTNIPSGTSRATAGPEGMIRKTAGTNNRKMYGDWAAYGTRKN